jgi:hypothetical protein
MPGGSTMSASTIAIVAVVIIAIVYAISQTQWYANYRAGV